MRNLRVIMSKVNSKGRLINPLESILSGIYLFIFAMIASLSWVFIDFISSNFWQENSIYGLIVLALLITFCYLRLVGIWRWKRQISSRFSGFLTRLFFVVMAFLMSSLASYSITNKTLPWLYTKVSGQPAELILLAQKKSFIGGKGCQTFLYFKRKSVNRICIPNNMSKYPDTEFKAKLIGKQSKLGFLVQSIEVAEQP